MDSSSSDLVSRRVELHSRNVNSEVQRKEFASKNASLMSDLKRATALAKRFKNYSAESSEKVILTQLDTINFGMFVSEAAQGVVQSLCHGTKMKPNDAYSFALVCSEVHQRYEGFWPLVRKGLKEKAEEILSLEALKTATERMDEAASTAAGTGDGSVPMVTTSSVAAVQLACSVLPGSTTASGTAVVQGRSPLEEFNRLRLVAKVFCEWWLVGLFDDSRVVLNLLKSLQGFVEKKASTSCSTMSIANLFSLIVLVIREIGIEMLGTQNMVFSCLPAANEKDSLRLRDLAGHCGTFDGSNTSNGNDLSAEPKIFLLGPAGFRLAINTTLKSFGPLDEILIQQAEETSWARLCAVCVLPHTFYSSECDKRQFVTLVFATARTLVTVYERLKEKLEGWWHSMCEQSELRAKTTRHAADEVQFRLLQEHLNKIYVKCDNLLGMLGFVAPLPADLSFVEHRSSVDITLTTVSKKFRHVVNVETLNRFRNDDQRVFYEYIPEVQCWPEELLHSLNLKKDLDALFQRKDLGGVTMTTTVGEGKGNEEVEESAVMHPYMSLEVTEESKTRHSKEMTAGMERRYLYLAELTVPAALFPEYAAVLRLLGGLQSCNTAAAVDEWYERFAQEAIRPLQRSPDSNVAARLFFTNCCVLLTLELGYYSRSQKPGTFSYLARCSAIMHQYFPDVGQFLTGVLEEQWRLECKSHAVSLTSSSLSSSSPPFCGDVTEHSRVVNAIVYLCELMKFGIVPWTRVQNILRTSIEELHTSCCAAYVLSTIIEHSGFFFLHSHATKLTMERLLERVRCLVKELGPEENEKAKLINASFAFLHPLPNASQRKAPKELSSIERYTRYLLHVVLSREKYSFVYTKMLKMPWDHASHCEMLVRTLREVHEVGWDAVPLVANLLADLARAGHGKVVERIVDMVSEDMRRDIEVHVAEETSGVCSNKLYPALGTDIHVGYRPMQWRIVDCVFISNLFRVRVVSFRFVCYILLVLLLYTPFPRFPKNESSRLCCCIAILDKCVSLLPWKKSNATCGTGKNASDLMGCVSNLHQLLRKLMALIFLHRYSLPEPVPLDLCYNLENLVEHLNTRLCGSDLGLDGDGNSGKNKKKNVRKGCKMKDESSGLPSKLQWPVETEISNPLGNVVIEKKGFILPKTMAEALTNADAVASEAVYPANKWFEEMHETIIGRNRDGGLHYRMFTVKASEESLIYAPETLTSVDEDTIEASMGLLQDNVVADVVEDATSEHIGEMERSSHSHVSRSLVGDSRSEGSGRDSGDDSSESGCVSTTSSTCTEHATDATDDYEENDEDEDEDEENDEDEDEENDEDEDEENDEDEDEECDEDEEENDEGENKFAATEALRLQLEEADLDAKLRALMSENSRDATCRTVSVAAKGGVVDRLVEQDLTAGIRLHRQQQQQWKREHSLDSVLQADASTEKKEKEEVRFMLLRRPIRNAPTASKAGGTVTVLPGSSSGAAVGVGGGSSCSSVLTIPLNSDFARSALLQQEQQRHQQEELREITRRINRMQEEEKCGGAPTNRSTK